MTPNGIMMTLMTGILKIRWIFILLIIGKKKNQSKLLAGVILLHHGLVWLIMNAVFAVWYYSPLPDLTRVQEHVNAGTDVGIGQAILGTDYVMWVRCISSDAKTADWNYNAMSHFALKEDIAMMGEANIDGFVYTKTKYNPKAL